MGEIVEANWYWPDWETYMKTNEEQKFFRDSGLKDVHKRVQKTADRAKDQNEEWLLVRAKYNFIAPPLIIEAEADEHRYICYWREKPEKKFLAGKSACNTMLEMQPPIAESLIKPKLPPVAPPPERIFFEDFEAYPVGTTNIAGITIEGGLWEVQKRDENKVYVQTESPGPGKIIRYGEITWTNYRQTFNGVGTGASLGSIVGFQDLDNFYYFAIGGKYFDILDLGKRVAGKWYVLARHVFPTSQIGVEHSFTMEFVPPLIKGTCAGVTLSVSDTSFAQGYAGNVAGGQNAWIDNLEVLSI